MGLRFSTLFGITVVLASSLAPALAQQSGKLCKLDAGFQSALRNVHPNEFLTEIAKKCVAGDIIVAPASHTYVLKKTCDFQKQIVVVRDEWMCAFIGVVRPD